MPTLRQRFINSRLRTYRIDLILIEVIKIFWILVIRYNIITAFKYIVFLSFTFQTRPNETVTNACQILMEQFDMYKKVKLVQLFAIINDKRR